MQRSWPIQFDIEPVNAETIPEASQQIEALYQGDDF
jgi:hypothetical protein